MELIRRVRLPVVVTLGIAYVGVLPWLGWNWAEPLLLFGTLGIFYWLPGLDTLVRNFKAGHAEEK